MRRHAGRNTLTDRLAQLLADSAGTEHDGDVVWCGAQLGLPMKRANNIMQTIRAAVGREQAR